MSFSAGQRLDREARVMSRIIRFLDSLKHKNTVARSLALRASGMTRSAHMPREDELRIAVATLIFAPERIRQIDLRFGAFFDDDDRAG